MQIYITFKNQSILSHLKITHIIRGFISIFYNISLKLTWRNEKNIIGIKFKPYPCQL
jgi:hypothetical protein